MKTLEASNLKSTITFLAFLFNSGSQCLSLVKNRRFLLFIHNNNNNNNNIHFHHQLLHTSFL